VPPVRRPTHRGPARSGTALPQSVDRARLRRCGRARLCPVGGSPSERVTKRHTAADTGTRAVPRGLG
jgi:hypothetical protein